MDPKCCFKIIGLFAGLSLLVPSMNAFSQKSPLDSQAAAPSPIPLVSPSKPSPLGSDPRLLTKVSLNSKSTTVSRALEILAKRTGVRLLAEGSEVGSTVCSFRYQTIPLKDILESIAALRRFEWQRRDHGSLVLKEGYDPHRFDTFRPHSSAQAEMFRLGRELKDQFHQLPADLQNALQDGPRGPSGGVPFEALPTGMQQILNDMIAADQADQEEQGVAADYGNPDNARISLSTVNHQEGFDNYAWRVTQPPSSGRGFGIPARKIAGQNMNIVTLTDPRDQNDRIVPPEQSFLKPPWYPDEEDTASKCEALSWDERLKIKVTLHLEQATLQQALQALSRKANISFASQDNGHTPAKTRTLDFADVSVKEVLDRLTTFYADTVGGWRRGYTWGERRSGIIMFRPARPVIDPVVKSNRQATWRAFLAQIKILSSSLRDQIQSKTGIAYPKLSRKMQRTIAEVLKAENSMELEKNRGALDDQFQATVRLETLADTESTTYTLFLTQSNGDIMSVDFSIPN